MSGQTIAHFRGEYYFLSNFYHSPVELDGVEYPSVENAFQAAKTLGNRYMFTHIEAAMSKVYGRKVELRPGWEGMKVDVMRQLLRDKFTRHPILAAKLLLTDPAELVEGNNWGDTFWGVDERRGGENNLGKLFMELRVRLLAEKDEVVEP